MTMRISISNRRQRAFAGIVSVYCGAFILTWSQAAVAQTLQATRKDSLQNVVVTATKFAKSQNETGKVLTVIDAAALRHHRGETLDQILADQSDIVVNGSGSNPGKDKSLFLRGAGVQYTLILIDGVPLRDPSGIGGVFDLRMIPVDQIARIEILRGGQSTLYGSDAVAGVINIITKKGAKGPLEASATVSAGNYGTERHSLELSGGGQQFWYQASYTHQRSTGISEATDTTGKAGFDKDGYALDATSVQLGWKPVSKWLLEPYFRYGDYVGATDEGSFTDGPDKFYDRSTQTGIESRYDIPRGEIHVNYDYQRNNRLYLGSSSYPYKGTLQYLDAYVNRNEGHHFQWIAGVNSDQSLMDATGVSSDSAKTEMWSVYASAFLRNWKGFNLEMGGRYNRQNLYGNNNTFTLNPSYQLNRHITVFLNYSSAFRAPTLDMLYGQFGPNKSLKPENSLNLEGGVSFYRLWDHGRDIRVSYFNRDIHNVIDYTDRYVNFDRQKDHGLELEASYLRHGWNIQASYTYVTGALHTSQNGKDTSYNNLYRKPAHMAGLQIGRNWKRMYLGAVFHYYSRRMDLDFSSYPALPVTLKGYALVNLHASYDFWHRRFQAFADIMNLTNTHYVESYGYNTLGLHYQLGIHVKVP